MQEMINGWLWFGSLGTELIFTIKKSFFNLIRLSLKLDYYLLSLWNTFANSYRTVYMYLILNNMSCLFQHKMGKVLYSNNLNKYKIQVHL